MTQSTDLPDELLITALQQRYRVAAEQLYARYAGILYRVICCTVKEPAQAEHLMILVFSKIWEDIGRYQATDGTFLLWMSGIARRLAKAHQNGHSEEPGPDRPLTRKAA